jgi:hypothetical protein
MVGAPDDGRPDAVRSATSASAVQTDGRELLLDESTRTALTHVRAPVRLLVAERGVLDDDKPLLPSRVVEEFTAARPDVVVEKVENTNHYSVLLGRGGGARRVTGAIRSALGHA